MAFDPDNDLEFSLVKATIDPAHRPQFYRDFLEAEVFVIERGPHFEGAGRRVLNQGQKLALETWEIDGRTILPIFSSVARLQASLKESVGYFAMNARNLLEIIRGTGIILNPGLEYGKKFSAQEIDAILDESIGKPDAQFVVPTDTPVQIGDPAVYPTELVATLQRYFRTKSQVKRAYFAHVFMPDRDTKSHAIVAVEVSRDWDDVFAGLSILVREVVARDEVVDFLQIRGIGGIEDHFRSGVKPFYEKKRFLGLF